MTSNTDAACWQDSSIFVDDLADACLTAMANYDSQVPINLSSGRGCSIRELADMIRQVVGFEGQRRF